jgi:hypothetical protein
LRNEKGITWLEMTVYYPLESMPIAWYVTLMGIGTILTVIGLFAAYKWIAIGPKWEGALKEIIPVSAIILAVVTPLISSVFAPILDYNVIPHNNTNKMKIILDNLGSKSAQDVQIYLNSPDLNFTKITSNPFILNGTSSFTSDKLQSGIGIFNISTLAGKSQTILDVTSNPNYTDNNNTVIVYVRSNESAGYHNLFSVSLAYLVLAIVLIIDAAYLIPKYSAIKKETTSTSKTAIRTYTKPFEHVKRNLLIINIIPTVLIFVILFFLTCEGTFNCHIASV